jgi:hypothetical protein
LKTQLRGRLEFKLQPYLFNEKNCLLHGQVLVVMVGDGRGPPLQQLNKR